eukprot:TRINITY_DN4824_c2_g1_i1.p1 TRINITY_DN4824_c2_g1~~TRINITY_DN4824_c2_g1_i1.p1  ORF type:complete len:959 (+),score=234.63 TRINITY_DN4824_c2_g1_i1:76-2952(+)
MAQHGRRTLRMRRLVDGSPGGDESEDGIYAGYTSTNRVGAISPPLLRGGATSDVEGAGINWDVSSQDSLLRRMKLIEDKSLLTDTASRHAMEEGDRIRSRLTDIETNSSKQIESLSSANKRDIDLLREWVSSFIEGHISDLEHQLRNTIRIESEGLQQKIRLNHDKIATAQTRSETIHKSSMESSKKMIQDLSDKVNSKITNVDRAVQDLDGKMLLLEAHFSDSIGVAIDREQSSRERDCKDLTSQLQHLQSNLTTIQRDITSSVAKVSDALSVSNERVNSLERFLKVEIKARMELSSAHDRLVDDLRKMERSHIAGVSQIQSFVQEKHSEFTQQMAQQTTVFKDNLSATSDACKKLITAEVRNSQADLHTTIQNTLQPRLDSLEHTSTDLGSKINRISLRFDESDKSLHELKRSQEREAAEAQSSITRSENKVDEQLQNVKQTLSEYCNTQVKNALDEISMRESNLRDTTTSDIKRLTETMNNHHKTYDADLAEQKRLLHEHKSESSDHLNANIDRVSSLVQRTDELTRIQIDRNSEIYQNVEAIKTTTEELQRQIKDEAHTSKKGIESLENRAATIEMQQAKQLTADDLASVKNSVDERFVQTDTAFQKILSEAEASITQRTDEKLRHILTENITNVSAAITQISEKQDSTNKEAQERIITIESSVDDLKKSCDYNNTLMTDNIGGLADLVAAVQKRVDNMAEEKEGDVQHKVSNEEIESTKIANTKIHQMINELENRMEVVTQTVTDHGGKVDAFAVKVDLHTSLIDKSNDSSREAIDTLQTHLTDLQNKHATHSELIETVETTFKKDFASLRQEVIITSNDKIGLLEGEIQRISGITESSCTKDELPQLRNDILTLSDTCDDISLRLKALTSSEQARREGDSRWGSWQTEIQSKLTEFYQELIDLKAQVDSNQHDVDYNITGLNGKIQEITAKMLSFCEAEQVQLNRRMSNPAT